MLLKEFIENPIDAYLKCERFINNGSPSKNNNTTSESTAPKSAVENFKISLVSFNHSVKTEDIGEKIEHIPSNAIYIHPDFLNEVVLLAKQAKVLKNIVVAPTSSGRTVLTQNTNPTMFLKLAYPKCLGRLTRHMGRDKILSACEVTNRLVCAIDNNEMNGKFALLKENKGRIAYIPDSKNIYEWGMIIRESRPYPYVDDEEYIMPFFSLFASEYIPGGNSTNLEHIYFIRQFYDAQKKDANSFMLEDLIFPLFDCYFDALLKAGIELEAHAQNMLFSFDKDFKIRRIICRDLESAGRDITLMRRLGIPCNTENQYKCNQLLPKDPFQKYEKWYITHSFMFDFKLGEYIITPLIECAKKCIPGINEKKLIRQIKNHNKYYISKLPDFFPPDWCYYSSENFEETGNVKTYIWEDNPKYR